ncbi:MAG: HupE/UreJ family protein [Cyanobacteriota bacterium]|nr:HupE/UreJ family protein [Cyanobacteriota bacterium]
MARLGWGSLGSSLWQRSLLRRLGQGLSGGVALFSVAGSWGRAAYAHHPLGGEIPATFAQGFLSGIAHPMIELDHLVFVIAVGLLALLRPRGLWIPMSFVFGTLLGSLGHLQGLEIPGLELGIAGSIVVIGILLALTPPPNLPVLLGLSGLAGLLHGYAYAEAIIGAENTPLLAYLLGFSLTQLLIALLAYGLGRRWFLDLAPAEPPTSRRFSLPIAGWVICGMGLAFLGSQLMEGLLSSMGI